MIQFELPCIFTENLDEILEAKDKDLPTPIEIETFQTTKFNIPSDSMIVYNSTQLGRTTLRVYSSVEEFSWMVNANYEIVNEIIQDAIKRSNK